MPETFTVVEFCAGGGGQAVGLEMAGFDCLAAIEIDAHCCQTLKLNRPHWNVIQADMRAVDGKAFADADLFAAGVPCPPFSIAGKQLGSADDRDMFPTALRLISEIKPRAVLLENVPGFASAKFAAYRANLIRSLNNLGYEVSWRVVQSPDFGVPQLRPRFILVGLPKEAHAFFQWPKAVTGKPFTVGKATADLMAANGWPGALAWAQKADRVAPTLVGGSKKHGGPDLGPTRAKRQWLEMGVDGKGLANQAPDKDFPVDGTPRLTVRMAARVQSFPDSWQFAGGKTASYRQVGNAFPPLVAKAVGKAIRSALAKQYPVVGEDMVEPVQLKLLEPKKPRQKKHEKKRRIKAAYP